MIPREMMQKIRRIEIRTSHKVDDVLSGQYHSAFKGRGIEFEEVRPYQVGDDVRAIDWNVTARSGEPFIKLFREERQLTVHLLVDVSASQSFGTQQQLKRELVAEVGATLAFSAIRNSDRIGLTLFSDAIEKVVPPGKGRRHVLRVIRELLYCEPIGRGTSVTTALEHLGRVAKRHSVVFVISDFQDEGYEQALRIARRRHDVIPILIDDERERQLPDVGLVDVLDEETGERMTLDTSSPRQRRQYAAAMQTRATRRDELFRQLRLDTIPLRTGDDFVDPLRKFFHKRESRR